MAEPTRPDTQSRQREDLKSDILLTTVYFHRLLQRHARASKESWRQISVLSTLDHHGPQNAGGNSLSQKQLAGYEQVSQAAISNLVSTLRDDGLVRCSTNSKDARTTDVCLTARGKRHLDRHGASIKTVIDDVIRNLPDSDVAKVAVGQRILADALRESPGVQRALQDG